MASSHTCERGKFGTCIDLWRIPNNALDTFASEVAKWLAHWLLVLEDPVPISTVGEEYLLVKTRFPSCHLQK